MGFAISRFLYPQRSLLLALEALKVVDRNELRLSSGEQALRDALLTAGGHALQVHEGKAVVAAFSPDGHWLVTAGHNLPADEWEWYFD